MRGAAGQAVPRDDVDHRDADPPSCSWCLGFVARIPPAKVAGTNYLFKGIAELLALLPGELPGAHRERRLHSYSGPMRPLANCRRTALGPRRPRASG